MLNTNGFGIRSFQIQKINEHRTELIDSISVEEPLEIILKFQNGNKTYSKSISITMRTPGEDEDLARGFLFNEGLLQDPVHDIAKMELLFDCAGDELRQQSLIVKLREGYLPNLDRIDRHFYTTSSCGVCGKASIDLMLDQCVYLLRKEEPKVNKEILFTLPEKLRSKQTTFHKTGGIHGCGIFDTDGQLHYWAEDVGRHNAMDKLCSKALMAGIVPLQNHIIVLSGRASFELVHKAAMIGCPILAAVGAPSSLAIETADAFGMSLVGFLKEHSANLYTHTNRIHG